MTLCDFFADVHEASLSWSLWHRAAGIWSARHGSTCFLALHLPINLGPNECRHHSGTVLRYVTFLTSFAFPRGSWTSLQARNFPTFF